MQQGNRGKQFCPSLRAFFKDTGNLTCVLMLNLINLLPIFSFSSTPPPCRDKAQKPHIVGNFVLNYKTCRG
jgi:hypothetical protein